MNNKDIIFNLIVSSFKSEIFQFNSDDESKLTQMIIENGLVGLVFNSLGPITFKDSKYYLVLKKAFNEYLIKDVKQNYYMNHLTKLLNNAKIDHLFLKGANLKKLYPKSYMRGMGDIDILVKKEDFEIAKSLLKENEYKFLSATSHHHVYETLDHIYIELHQSIISVVDYENSDFLSHVWSNVIGLENNLKKLKPEFEYIYLLTHLIRHIRTSGVGLRSLIDIYVYMNHYKDIFDCELLNSLLINNSLSDFSEKMIHINKIILGKENSTSMDEEVIEYILRSGIHGTGKSHDKYITKSTFVTKRQKTNRIKYFLNEVFPSRLVLKENYSYLKKYPILLPYAWIERIFKQIFLKPKDTKDRLKAVKGNKLVNKVDEIYKYLGI